MKNFLILAPALVGVTILATPAHAENIVLTATLTGAAETGGGAAKATGAFRATVDTSSGDVCYTLSTTGLPAATAAHIHEGAEGADGKPVITVDVTGANDEYCLAAEPDLLDAINAAPGNYYVNVHTREFPAGAVRGQLAVPGRAAAPAPVAAPEPAAAPAVPPAAN